MSLKIEKNKSIITMGSCTSQQPASTTQQLLSATFENTSLIGAQFTIAKVIKVYDGDTVWIAVRCGDEICRFMCRLYGVDTDELRSKDPAEKKSAERARVFVTTFCLNKLVNVTVRDARDKYGRLLVNISVDGVDLAGELLRLGLARPYFGGHK
jgi:endonuclease YncB( thermonuclease family)